MTTTLDLKKHVGLKDILTTASGLSGKTITSMVASSTGSTVVVEISFSGGSAFLKFQHGLVEIGGDSNWGTGTQFLKEAQ